MSILVLVLFHVFIIDSYFLNQTCGLKPDCAAGRPDADDGEARHGGHGEGEAGVPEDHVERPGVHHADQSQVSV